MLLVVGSTSPAGETLGLTFQDLFSDVSSVSVMLLVVGSTSPAGETLGLTCLQSCICDVDGSRIY